jgi:hypothetical protein
MKSSPEFAEFAQAWAGLLGQMRPSPHLFTNL